MRRALIAAMTSLLVAFAMPVSPAFAASSARVVVVVGPVGSSTAHYKSDAAEIVAEAKRYTTNVVKITTPNATWPKVKAAAQGASIFVYLGHGNGWPSPYPPFQTQTKDGLGLDPGSGADGTRTVYYGEEFIRSNIRLAPNAVVLLYHLCYASGNTEPGKATGSFSDSRLRVDNYGAGFIGAGARAVFAEGHPSHPNVNYLRQLFTTNRTMDQVFRRAPTAHGHFVGPYASQRSPDLYFELDPDTTTPSGFYRSLVGDLSLTASQVVAPDLVRTDRDPDDFVVPGAAEVSADGGAGLFATPETAADPAAVPPSTLAGGTRLRVTAEADQAADGIRILAVSVLGKAAKGYARASALAPRDSAGVLVWTLDQSAPWLSPNADKVNDAFALAVRFTEPATAALSVKNAGGKTVKSLSSSGELAHFAWDLRSSSGVTVGDGAYAWSLRAADTWGNPAVSRTGTFTVDSTAPVSRATSEATAGGSGWLVTPASVTLTAKDALSGVKSLAWRLDGGASTTYPGDPVKVTRNGTHTFEYRATDKAGVREAWKSLTFKIDTRAPAITLPLSGTAGDTEGMWRGRVTVTPAVKDTTSGTASKTVSVDGKAATALGTTPVVVTGNGEHTVKVTAVDKAGNKGAATATFTIDTEDPVIELPAAAELLATVSPNGDGTSEQLAIPYAVSEAGRVKAVITDAKAVVVRTITTAVLPGANSLGWDGRTAAGAPVADGRYTLTMTPRDLAGNSGVAVATEVDVYGALKGLSRTPSLFFPQDADRLATRTSATFTLLAPASVTIRVLDKAGAVVRTGPTDKALPAGPGTWTWNGRTDAGAFVPRGGYRIAVTATNGTQGASQMTTVLADAFRLATSVTSAVRGKSLTITAVTAETLATTPRVVVRQPGRDPWTVTMTKKGGSTWTVVVTPKKGGTAGTLSLTVKASDAKGGRNSSVVRLALR